MAIYTKRILSGSTNGRPIKVVQTATAGTIIHTSVSGESDVDELWLYAMNTSSAAVKLTIEFGGVSSPDDLVEASIPAEDGLYLVIPGIPLQNSLVARAFAASANVVTILGFVNRITA